MKRSSWTFPQILLALLGLGALYFIVKKIYEVFFVKESFSLPSRTIDSRCLVGTRGAGPTANQRIFNKAQCDALKGTLTGFTCTLNNQNLSRLCNVANTSAPSFCTPGVDNSNQRQYTKDECTAVGGVLNGAKCMSGPRDDLALLCANLNRSTVLTKEECDNLKGKFAPDGTCRNSAGLFLAQIDVMNYNKGQRNSYQTQSKTAVSTQNAVIAGLKTTFETSKVSANNALAASQTSKNIYETMNAATIASQQALPPLVNAFKDAFTAAKQNPTEENKARTFTTMNQYQTGANDFNTKANAQNGQTNDLRNKNTTALNNANQALQQSQSLKTNIETLIAQINLIIVQAQKDIVVTDALVKAKASAFGLSVTPASTAENELAKTDQADAKTFLEVMQTSLTTAQSELTAAIKNITDMQALVNQINDLAKFQVTAATTSDGLVRTAQDQLKNYANDTATVPPPGLLPNLIRIVDATYGRNCPNGTLYNGNATQVFRNTCGEATKSFCDTNPFSQLSIVTAKPPAGSCPANLDIAYSCNGGWQVDNMLISGDASGKRVMLDCGCVPKNITKDFTYAWTNVTRDPENGLILRGTIQPSYRLPTLIPRVQGGRGFTLNLKFRWDEAISPKAGGTFNLLQLTTQADGSWTGAQPTNYFYLLFQYTTTGYCPQIYILGNEIGYLPATPTNIPAPTTNLINPQLGVLKYKDEIDMTIQVNKLRVIVKYNNPSNAGFSFTKNIAFPDLTGGNLYAFIVARSIGNPIPGGFLRELNYCEYGV